MIALDETVAPNVEGDVLEVAAASGQFQIFLALVEAAGMQETLRGDGPFTLFAPTDAAFEAMPKADLDRLRSPAGHDEAMALVSYHVVADRIDIVALNGRTRRVEAADGHMLTLDARDGLRVNDHLVVAPDIIAANGVIMGLNQVLSPTVRVASH